MTLEQILLMKCAFQTWKAQVNKPSDNDDVLSEIDEQTLDNIILKNNV